MTMPESSLMPSLPGQKTIILNSIYFLVACMLLPLRPIAVAAQQVNTYSVCTNYQESYTPGYYGPGGGYVQGNVTSQAYNAECGAVAGSRPIIAQPRNCAATPIGVVLGGFGAYRLTSRVQNRWWSVPLGAVTGGIVGNALCN